MLFGSRLQILLTFTGFHDPYSKGLIAEEDQPGPILSLLRVRTFDAIYLLTTPNTKVTLLARCRHLIRTRPFSVSLFP